MSEHLGDLADVLPAGMPVLRVSENMKPGQPRYVVRIAVKTRREAFDAWRLCTPLALTVVRRGNGVTVKPAELITRDDQAAYLVDDVHPIYWRHLADGTRMLVWWAEYKLRENESSRVMVRFDAVIANDPAWLADRHRMGGARGDVVIAYEWKEREYPRGEVVRVLSNIRDKPGERLVWFSSDAGRVGIGEALGVEKSPAARVWDATGETSAPR